MNPPISVALCTYNGERFIVEQLRSIGRQTLQPDELVVVDDASADSTVALVREWARQAPFDVKVFVNPTNLGVAANFERALSLCVGNVLVTADQDDVWLPDKLARLTGALTRQPEALLAHSDALVVDAALNGAGQTLLQALALSVRERAELAQGRTFDVLLRRNLVTGCTMAFRRSLLELARPFAASWLHDEWLAVVAAATGPIAFIDEPLVLYRQHASNQLGVGWRTGLAELRWLMAGRGGVRARLPVRLGQLLQHLEALGAAVTAGRLAQVRRALAHVTLRAGLPVGRWSRVAPVWREWRAGGYAEHSRGLRSIVCDLIEPIARP